MAPLRSPSLLILLTVVVLTAGIVPTHPLFKQGDEISELISVINGLRASYNLAPYIVDPALMAMAQEHSAYQASIHTSTHQHSDGRGPMQIGVVENVAGGDIGYLDPHAAVYEIWADAGHMRTMVGYPAGSMGVGIADDGETTYYTLEVIPVKTTAKAPNPSNTGNAPGPQTPIPILPLITMTPRSDGSIVHIVGYGQTLWSIALAYGIRVEQIRAWNNIPEGSNDIYAGQKLLVRPASLAVATATPTEKPGAVQYTSAAVTSPANITVSQNPTLPPSRTSSLPAQAAFSSTETEKPVGTQTPSSNLQVNSEQLVPLIAGCSILVGFGLLIILRTIKKQ